ncbi:WD40 repeat-like protein [Suillus weaverae]|nr:WD40 repeat-like protein [Suillus weaverae]
MTPSCVRRLLGYCTACIYLEMFTASSSNTGRKKYTLLVSLLVIEGSSNGVAYSPEVWGEDWILTWNPPAPTMSSSTSKTPAIMPRRTMQGHADWVNGVVHLHGGRRQIITCSLDGSLRLWDLESGAQIGEDWRDEDDSGMWSMALSSNGKTVASGSGGMDNKVRLWDVETRKVIAKWVGHSNVVCTLSWSPDGDRVLSGSWDGTARVWDVKSGKNSNATRRPPIQARRIPPAFFDGVQNGAQSSVARGTHHSSPAHNSRSTRTPLLERLSSLFHHSQVNTDDATELQQRPWRSIFSRGPPIVEVAAVKDREVIFTAPPPPQKTQQQTQSHAQGSSATPPAPGTNPSTPRPRYPHSLPVRVLAHLVLFLCCASQHPDRNAQQQQGQSQGQVHAQASSSHTQPAAPSTSATPTAPDTHTTAPGTASP